MRETTPGPLDPTPADSTGDAVDEIAPGDVLRITAGPGGKPELLLAVLLDQSDEENRVLVVSPDTHYATNWDLLIEGPSESEFMAEVWNQGTISEEQIVRPLFTLTDQEFDQLQLLYDASVQGTEPPEGLATGVSIQTDRDPRLRFQQEEHERAQAYLDQPQPQPEQAPASLADVVAAHANERHVTVRDLPLPEEVVLLISVPTAEYRWAQVLLGGEVDLFQQVPVSDLAKVWTLVGMPQDQRFAGLLHDAVFTSYRGEAVSQSLSLARRRLGHRAHGHGPDEEARRRAADQYTARFFKQLRSS